MADKLTKEQITEKFRKGEITPDEMLSLMEEVNRKPPRFGIGEKGWLSIYNDGMRFPISIPYAVAVTLFSDETVARVRQFLHDHKSEFKIKK